MITAGSVNPLLLEEDAKTSSGFLTKSLRFRTGASAHLTRSFSNSTTQTFTFSTWLKLGKLGIECPLITAGVNTSNWSGFLLAPDQTIRFTIYESGIPRSNLKWLPLLRDPSSWYHLVCVCDTNNATANQRVRIYINGVGVEGGHSTEPTENQFPDHGRAQMLNSGNVHSIGRRQHTANNYSEYYLSETYFIDGQALDASAFGEFSPEHGGWQAKKYAGTYGTNGFHLKFEDMFKLGSDSSGAGHDWTPNGFSTAADHTMDQMNDAPTLTDETHANYATLNPLAIPPYASKASISEGNLSLITASNEVALSTIPINSIDKVYFEVTAKSTNGNNSITICNGSNRTLWEVAYYQDGRLRINAAPPVAHARSWGNEVIGCSFDRSSSTVQFYLGGSAVGSAIVHQNPTNADLFAGVFNEGGGFYINFGQQPFKHTPPAGFKPLNTFNLPEPTIKQGNKHFDAVLDGGATIKSKAEALFTNRLEWIKSRANSSDHQLLDTVRGANALHSNNTNAEGAYTAPSGNSVAWVWNSNSPAVANTDGTIASQVSVNKEAGFSIVKMTSPATVGANSCGHGLGVQPHMMILKGLDHGGGNWIVWHHQMTGGASNISKYLYLNAGAGERDLVGGWGNSAATSTTFGVGSHFPANQNVIVYCFAEVYGYSKFGSYAGNGNADGVFVHTGFRPRYIMIKNRNSGDAWQIVDTARSQHNLVDIGLYANVSDADLTLTPHNRQLDILSNGFKLKGNSAVTNASGSTYLYMAFAEHPFRYALAR